MPFAAVDDRAAALRALADSEEAVPNVSCFVLGSLNLLNYGDNLDVLRRHLKDEAIDLVYIDPRFKSNVNYKGPIEFVATCRGETKHVRGRR